jgi:hypothetical protein
MADGIVPRVDMGIPGVRRGCLGCLRIGKTMYKGEKRRRAR